MTNMVAIQTVTVGSGGAANITFSNIPQTYTDLLIVYSLRTTQTGTYVDGLGIRFNGDSGSNYPYIQLYGTGSSGVGTNSGTVSFIYGRPLNGASSTANTFGNGQIYIPNYTSSNSKSVSVDSVTEGNAVGSDQGFVAQRWTGTSAINSIVMLDFGGGSLVQYSTATLYGVTNAAAIAKATGGLVTYDSNYFYHTFTASGTFTPLQSLTADYLVVAGGGGGGAGAGDDGGGGGAGGLRCTVGATGGGGSLEAALSLTAQAYTVTIGAGGTGGGVYPGTTISTAGSNSVFSSITSTGGGRGGGYNNSGTYLGTTGGSGGGNRPGYSSLAGTANQGYAGGVGDVSSSYYAGGGGGGAGGTGSNGNSSTGNGGAGGTGVTTSISGSSATYAGGGGGNGQSPGTAGTGGAGGGGNGGQSGSASAGTANTGGGGGGARGTGNPTTQLGGAGGSGIVIVRYAR